METFNFIKHKHCIILFFVSILFSVTACNAVNDTDESKDEITIIDKYSYVDYDAVIEDLYKNVAATRSPDIVTRIAAISEYFLDADYLLFPLGEGEGGKFNQLPLYRTDAFDCVTYVETVLALAHASDLEQFKENMLNIRYQCGNPSFVTRNHFTSVDWNKNNTHNGYVKDITYKFTDESGQPVAEVANGVINKPGWYQNFKARDIKLLKAVSTTAGNQLLEQLHDLSQQVQQEQSTMLYLPISKLFDKDGNPVQDIFDQIPEASIIDIIRPNWDLVKQIGTNLHVSHVGFAIRTDDQLYYREASSVANKIIDIPLTEYLQQYDNNPNTTVKGIAVLAIRPLNDK